MSKERAKQKLQVISESLGTINPVGTVGMCMAILRMQVNDILKELEED